MEVGWPWKGGCKSFARTEAHLNDMQPELWASDDEGACKETLPNGDSWRWRHSVNAEAVLAVRPAVVHCPRSKEYLAEPVA
jgi:hypothetical protein